jgi:hypothetical protein
MRLVKGFVNINRWLSQGMVKRFPRLATGGDYKGGMSQELEDFIITKKTPRASLTAFCAGFVATARKGLKDGEH